MSVSKEITRLEKSNVRLSLTIPKEDVLSQYQDLLKDYSKNVQLPGFRRGKAPQNVLERKFGEALKGEALGKIIEKAIGEVFDNENLPADEKPLPYSQPQLQDEPKLEFDRDMVFSIVYDVLPKVTVGQWKGLEVESPDVAVTDEDIARELEEVRERNSFVLDLDEGAEARKGNVVTVNYCELDDSGEALPNSQREDFSFTLGSVQTTYMFDDDIAGMKKGETKEFTKVYPESTAETPADPQKSPLAGTTKKFRVTLTALKDKKLPDLDDDLAQDVDEKFKTLDDLKNSIRERLDKNLKRRVRELSINSLLEKIMGTTPVILPESMVQAELEARMRSFARNLGADADKIMQMFAQDGEGAQGLYDRWRPSVEKALHSRLIVDAIMEEQRVDISDTETEAEIASISAESGESIDELKKRFEENNSIEYLKDEMKERKLFDLLLAENTVKTGSKANYLDVMANNG